MKNYNSLCAVSNILRLWCAFNCTYRWLYLKIDGSELNRLSFGMADGGVEGMGADGGVEDGGLLAGRGRLVWSKFRQHRDRVLWWLNWGRLQQLARSPLGTLGLDHKLLLLVLLNQGVWLNLCVRWKKNNTSLVCFLIINSNTFHTQIHLLRLNSCSD